MILCISTAFGWTREIIIIMVDQVIIPLSGMVLCMTWHTSSLDFELRESESEECLAYIIDLRLGVTVTFMAAKAKARSVLCPRYLTYSAEYSVTGLLLCALSQRRKQASSTQPNACVKVQSFRL